MKKLLIISIVGTLLLENVCAADYYVRPSGGSYGLENGSSYTNAWDGFKSIDWAVVDSSTGKLFVAGTHREQLVVGASGESGTPVQIVSCEVTNGASIDDPGVIVGSVKLSNPDDWTALRGGNLWHSPVIRDGSGCDYRDCYDIGFVLFGPESQENVGTKVWTQAEVDQDRDFFYDVNNYWIVAYTSDNTNPAGYYSDIEVAYPFDVHSTDDIVRIRDKDYVVVDGLTVKYGNGSLIRIHYESAGCNNVIVQNCNVSYGGGKQQDTGVQIRYGNGINVLGNASNILVQNNVVSQIFDLGIDVETGNGGYTISNVTFDSNKVMYCGGGIDFATNISPVSVTNCIASNNIVQYSGAGWAEVGETNMYGYGLLIFGMPPGGNVSATFHNNLVEYSEGFGVSIKRTGSDVALYNNIIRYNKSDGIAMTNPSSATPKVKIYYNLIYGNEHNGIFINSRPVGEIYNNVLYDNGSNSYNAQIFFNEPANKVIIKNNIFYAIDSYAFYDDQNWFLNNPTSNHNYNLFYRQLGDVIYYNGISYDLDHVIGANSGYYSYDSKREANALAQDPQFYNLSENNFYLSETSPCINAGTEVGLIQDYDGTSVPQGNGVDVGAYEYSGPPDTIPPTGTVTINNGDPSTYTPNVFLSLSASDYDEGLETSIGQELDSNGLMSFSNDNLKWSDPEPYASGKVWVLLPGDGEKTVYVKFSDAAGNWMVEPAQDQIFYQESENTCDDPQNLIPVSSDASSGFSLFSDVENAFDGELTTKWSALTFFSKDQFITLDLGEIKRLSGLNMYASRLFGTDFFPTDFQIQVSRDNIAWANLMNERGYASPIQPPYYGSWDFDSLECRYLRVYITQSKTLFFFFYLSQIAEIEIYGCDKVDYIPLAAEEDSLKRDEKQGEYNRKGVDYQERDTQSVPSIPGKPEITFGE